MSGADALAAAPRVSLVDRVRALREALAAKPGFRRWAARFPLTRPFARRRARALFDLCAGFVYTQVLFACVRLRVFAILAEAPLTTERLAPRLALSPEATDRLMAAAAALQLTARRTDGAWTLGQLGAAMIGNDGIAAMVEHHAMLYADLADPVAMLRRPRGGNALSDYWAYSGAAAPGAVPAERIRDYTALMAASQPMVAEEVLAAYRFDRHRRVLDVGGGNGAFLRAVAAEAPRLDLMLFDLPAVAEEARARFAAAGLGARANVHGGDFTQDALPPGADLVTLVRVLHDHDDEVALGLLRRIHAALPPGGALLLAEPMAGTSGAEPMGEAYFGFYLLAMGRGRPRTPKEIRTMIATAGFSESRMLSTPTPLLTRAVLARKAA
ncbi:acetylserotonin O-methyltransferase [Roseomonas sp. CECT 9278]|uniref:acetylserotonin O-methyltransferase n=1 Tax=Roseomonas sp. CECT 9278 TaxID=2845823 RepID=UPI001E4CA0DB|nr:acetylserotonin O-methyltransferase [Roseomonas sp. CECT 9278]CAH0276408.1 Demethylspheroidene O-methyltransferase [Roseomonas sp. CECT 9278]